jgi:hypothetical protein
MSDSIESYSQSQQMENSHQQQPAFSLVTGKTDKEIADEIRINLIEKLSLVCKEFDEAKEKGFIVQFTFGQDYRQKTVIQQLIISKQF